MDLYNPYDKPEVSQEFPWGLAVIFGLAVLVLGVSVWLIWMRGRQTELRKKLPEWVFNVAYPAFFLLLPFVMLISTMLFFPCWWQDCPEEGVGMEQVDPAEQPNKESVW